MGENPHKIISELVLYLKYKLKVMSVLIKKSTYSNLAIFMLVIAVIAVLLLNIFTLITLF